MKTYKLESGWIIDERKMLIYKKSIPFLSWLFTSLGCCKTSVQELYSILMRSFVGSDMMKYTFPIDHDNLPKPKGYPSHYILQGRWRIDRSSIKFLKNGPLFSENGHDVIVSEKIFVKTLFSLVWNFIISSGIILGFFISVYQIYLWFFVV